MEYLKKFELFNFLKRKNISDDIDLSLIKDLIQSDLDESILSSEIEYDECYYEKNRKGLPNIKSGYIEIPINSSRFNKKTFRENLKYVDIYRKHRGGKLSNCANGIILQINSTDSGTNLYNHYKEYYDTIKKIFENLNTKRFDDYNIGICLCSDDLPSTFKSKFNILFYNK